MKRKGFALVVLLFAVLIVMAAGYIISQLFKPLASGVPHMQRLSNENSQVCDMLRDMQRDIDSADALPEKFGKHSAGDSTLLIRQGKTTICYNISAGQGVREVLQTDGNASSPRRAETWLLPNAKISLQRLLDAKTGHACAVQVSSAVINQEYEHKIPKFANSHVFFIDGMGGKLESNK